MTVAEHSTLQLTGQDGTTEFEVNPESEYFRMKVGKETRMFKISELWAITFAICGPEQQEKMTPVRRTEIVTYKRIHKVMLKKDMRKGETVKVHCEINVEKTVVEGLKGLVEQNASKFSNGVPIIGK